MRPRQEPKLSAERLRELLRYEPDAGKLVWIKRAGSRGRAGAVAGSAHGRGYTINRIDGCLYLTHRLVWLYVTGAWPSGLLDHIDGDRLNNRFENLREATTSQNGANRGRAANNKSGFKGVSWHPRAGRWRAQINFGKIPHHLGLFDTPEAAHAAYSSAAIELHGQFARPK